MDPSPIIVITTVPDPDQAAAIIQIIIRDQLAACGQKIGPITSWYHWEGKVESTVEWQCWFKTTKNHYNPIEAAIRNHHPNQIPQIIAIPITAGFRPYLDWITDNVT